MAESRSLNEQPAGGHRVVVVGGGFGGLQAVHGLLRADVDITLIDRRNFHLFQPLTYQVATGALTPGEVAAPLRAIFKGDDNVRVLMGEVTGFDLERRVVHAEPEVPEGHTLDLPYDTLIVAAGAAQSYFGHDELARWAPGMKSLDDALELRRRLFHAFEAAEARRTSRACWRTPPTRWCRATSSTTPTPASTTPAAASS